MDRLAFYPPVAQNFLEKAHSSGSLVVLNSSKMYTWVPLLKSEQRGTDMNLINVRVGHSAGMNIELMELA
jgi:hypothetical protein